MSDWYEVIRTFFVTDEDDSPIDNQVIITTQDPKQVTRALKRLSERNLQESEVITYDTNPDDHLALAHHPDDGELGRQSASDWLQKHG